MQCTTIADRTGEGGNVVAGFLGRRVDLLTGRGYMKVGKSDGLRNCRSFFPSRELWFRGRPLGPGSYHDMCSVENSSLYNI